MSKEISVRELLLGALVGGLVAGASVSLLTTKKGKKFKRDVEEKYRGARSKIDDFMEDLSDKSQSVSKTVGDSASDWTEKVKNFVGCLKSEAENLANPEKEGLRTGVMIGGLVGVILATGAVIAYNRNCEDCQPGEFVEKLGSRISAGKEVLQHILETIKEQAAPIEERLNGKVKKESAHSLNEILELATAGVQLWNRFKQR